MTSERLDFFLSHTGADIAWARWFDSRLRERHVTRLHVYDGRPDESIVQQINRDLEGCDWVLCLASSAYFRSRWCEAEWQAAFESQKLLLVRLEECRLPALIAAYSYLDLVGLAEDAAREALERLLARLEGESLRPPGEEPYPIERSRPPPRFPGALPSLWNLPRQRNPHFTGRDVLLEQLHARLDAVARMIQVQAIAGLGGAGKSELVLEYAYRYAAEYDGIWWLRAEDTTTLAADYASLATGLGLERAVREASDQGQIVGAVRSELSRRERFLLIFDNAVETLDLEPFLPQGPTSKVLLTTRAQSWPGAQTTDIGMLSRAEAAQFLLKRTGQADEAAALGIAELLGDLPLALEQAATYAETRKKSLRDYARLLEARGLEALDHGAARHYGSTVRVTLTLALNELGPAAADLLSLCAFLAPEAIHLSDLSRAAARQRRAEHPSGLPARLARVLCDEIARDDAKAELLQYSLIGAEGDVITVHRLVQEVTREHLDQAASGLFLVSALRALQALFPQEPSAKRSWADCTRLLSHARAVVDREGALELDPSAAVDLLGRAGLYLKTRAAYSEAEPLYARALQIAENSFDPAHPAIATCLNNLGELWRARDRLPEAEELFQRALVIDRSALGDRHPDVARDLNNLGLVLKEMGRTAEAEAHFRGALAIDEAALPSSDFRVAIDLNNLATLLQARGLPDQAEPLVRRAIAIARRSLDPDDPSLAAALSNLAGVLRDRKQIVEAEALYREAQRICESTLGADHPLTRKIASRLERLRSASPES